MSCGIAGIVSVAGIRRNAAVNIAVQTESRLYVDDGVKVELPVLGITSVAAIRIGVAITVQA